MLNAKVLKMVKDVSVTGKVVTKRPEPVTLDEIDELLDEAAEASTAFDFDDADDTNEPTTSECECGETINAAEQTPDTHSDNDITIIVSSEDPDYAPFVRNITEIIRGMIFGMLQGIDDFVNDKIVLSDSISYPDTFKDEKAYCGGEVIKVLIASDAKIDFTTIYASISTIVKMIKKNFKACVDGKVEVHLEMKAAQLLPKTAATVSKRKEITSSSQKKEISEKAADIVVEKSEISKEMMDSLYPIAIDAKCASCGETIKKGDIIQFDKNGNIYHSSCKFSWGECSLEVMQPASDSVNLFGETYDTKFITEKDLQLAELKTKVNPSLRSIISLSKFVTNYGEYISKLNADDLIKSKVSTLKKDSKANIVKLENIEAKAE